MRKFVLGIVGLVFLLLCAAVQSFAAGPSVFFNCAGAASCSTPATGDVMNEGFEGCSADGSSGCDKTWTTTGSGVTYNLALPGTPPTGACSKGVEINGDGLDYITYDNGTGLTTYWAKFSFYVVSHSLANFAVTDLFAGGSAVTAVGAGLKLQLMNNNGIIGVRANNNTNSTVVTNLNGVDGLGTWVTIEMCSTDGGLASDPCGAGTNGYGWIKVNGGAAVPLACVDTVDNIHRYFSAGVLQASKTARVVLGNIQIDDDGTY